MESKLLRLGAEGIQVPPVFIIGAPRSGTTLLYELLVTHYEFSYFTNLANSFQFTPLSVSKLGLCFKRNWSGTQESNFGSVSGVGAPSEAGSIWKRWIPEFGFLDESVAEDRRKSLAEAANVIGALQKVQGAPFINKNVMHSVHIRLLAFAFPGCLFIELRRERKATVRSIVRARKKGGGPALDVDGWWSVRPRGVDLWCGLSLEEQACAQVVMLQKDIEDSFKLIGKKRCLIVNYEDVCKNPSETLRQVAMFVMPVCGELKSLHPSPAPVNMPLSVCFSPRVESAIKHTLATLEER